MKDSNYTVKAARRPLKENTVCKFIIIIIQYAFYSFKDLLIAEISVASLCLKLTWNFYSFENTVQYYRGRSPL